MSALSSIDPDLGSIVDHFGPPPMWEREEGFPTLVHIILEQQVSLASAKAAFDKLNSQLMVLNPHNFLGSSDEQLKAFGFSRQKMRYCRNLAIAIKNNDLDLCGLNNLSDEKATEALEKIVGIGPWTSGIYLLMALKRPDIWPQGDLALITAIKNVKKLESRPDNAAVAAIASAWHPWRAVAARILWHFYLCKS